MENNNAPRKARFYYKGESIPVLVVAEYEEIYELLLDWNKWTEESGTVAERERKRNLYLDALFGWEGAHETHKHVSAVKTPLAIDNSNLDVYLVFDEPEQEEGEPSEMTEPDNVVPFPKVAKLVELDKQLNLMAHLNYEVKSWDISFPEDGEPQLYATFTKVEEVHPF